MKKKSGLKKSQKLQKNPHNDFLFDNQPHDNNKILLQMSMNMNIRGRYYYHATNQKILTMFFLAVLVVVLAAAGVVYHNYMEKMRRKKRRKNRGKNGSHRGNTR